MKAQAPIKTDIVLVGGGHAHVEVLRRFGMRPEPGVRLTVISREVLTPYSGMLPGLIAGHYTFDEAHIDLAPLAQFAGARLFHDEVTGIDLLSQEVSCRHRPAVSYDLLSIDTGSEPQLRADGDTARAIPAKPVSGFFARWKALFARVVAGSEPLTVGVVGGGAGGVELVMAARHRLRAARSAGGFNPDTLQFRLMTAGRDILPTHAAAVRRRYRAALAQAGIEVDCGFEVVTVGSDSLTSADGQTREVHEALWVTHAGAPRWPREAGLATDDTGFIRVGADLRSVSHPDVFAAGDVAAVDPHPRPKSGVFAVRQGPPLADNLRRAARGEACRPFTPQRQFLSLISTGDQYAVASRGPFATAGRWVWRWKDFIDRRFMQRYQDLPDMTDNTGDPADDALLDAMRCGGCGSKIGAEVLEEALSAMAPDKRDDVLIGLDEPDDAAVVRVPPGALAVHTVDAFRSFIDDPWVLGKVAAVHGLSDIYAMGATPRTALAMVTLPYAKTSVMRDDLMLLMQGALEILGQDDTTLVGGHTAEGADLAIGFAINGHVEEQALVRKRGARVGDKLILTQALGSGILFAAAMQGKARAEWIETALSWMTRSKHDAATILCANHVRAMTDVTGFGLVGHLHEMLGESLGASIAMPSLHYYPGTQALAHAGVLSTLQPENRRAEQWVDADGALRDSGEYELIFDPQTAGGLLGAVPADSASDAISALHEAGYTDSAVIGNVVESAGRIRLEA